MGNNPKTGSPAPTPQKKSISLRGVSKKSRQEAISALADYISSPQCKRIVLMLGAGVSTSAGIPDFRSPKTGLYSNLQRLNLPHPEAVFEINFFRRNPVPFYTLAHELYPGKYRPTPTHSFIRLLEAHKLLHMCFTQNIDTLERRAGAPEEKIIEAHGSFATQRCIDCFAPFKDAKEMHRLVEKMEIPKCARCGGLVKPDIVFFGEALPARFVNSIHKVSEADLLIVIGTSLTVHPFASLAGLADPRICPRVLINMERVGDFGRRPDDVVLLGECDETVRELCNALQWEAELDALWAETAKTVEGITEAEVKRAKEKERAKEEAEERERKLEEDVGKLAAEIEASLDLSDEEEETLEREIEEREQEAEQAVSSSYESREMQKPDSSKLVEEKKD